ncbi:Sec63-domain-containing protein [Atractiella rhizophila]|nr:Sec63-domain-containing protein [Atractiella rhizophila]
MTDDQCSAHIFEDVFSSSYSQLDQIARILSRRAEVLSTTPPATHALRGVREETTPSAAQPNRGPPPLAGSQRAMKDARKAERQRRLDAEGEGGVSSSYDYESGLSLEEMERRRREQLEANAARGLFMSERAPLVEEERYPNVYTAAVEGFVGGKTLSFLGSRYALPLGTQRVEHENYEEITIPAAKRQPPRLKGERTIGIDEFPREFRGCFPGYTSLNRLQSLVFPLAFSSSTNLLVCAPTGAGKTDVALLTILRAIQQHGEPYVDHGGFARLKKRDWKIVYVAPMKALAGEVVAKMKKRLGGLGVKVRELTGDMQMTRQEIAETQMIVTTPEKWDVVTRKPSFATHVGGGGGREEEIVMQVKLLIIDEVHLLNEDRGAVIETIVARTLRLVETTQSLIRIVGLSATLPNYVDVADFLRVNRYEGLFYFDSSFRPVPLEQHFIGVKGKNGSQIMHNNMDEATFEQVSRLIKAGHQVMVFVHARKETVKTAQTLREKALQEEGMLDLLMPDEHPKYGLFKKEASASRNKELKELMAMGFGIHHAGMLRSDRNLSERMFEQGITKVLCCTSTLAWGVNLPAYAVVIKGTQIYDSSKGSNVDLSILDVLQIFGRAGRPQYESQGVGYICTSQDKLDHYVTAVTQQIPIESKFVAGMVDALNAEISLGNVNSVDEGVRWIGYTYLFVRMRKNPMVYGMTMDDVADDPYLGSKRLDLITAAAKKLAEAQMIIYDQDLGTLTATEIGRIASRYYIRHASIEIFNGSFKANLSEADMLSVLSSSVEFKQIVTREAEVPDLKRLLKDCPCQVKGGTDTSEGKINILLQSYISKVYLEDFALVSDTNYVAQNAGRIARALLDIAIHRKWGVATLVCASMSKAIEKRMWPFDHPLLQCDLSQELLYNIQQWADELTVEEIAEHSPADFGKLIHLNERLGGIAVQAAKRFPKLNISVDIRPLAGDVLQLRFDLRKAFDWSEKIHRNIEGFWLWVEDADANILRLHHILLRQQTSNIQQEFNLFFDSTPSSITIRLVSDRWIGNEQEQIVPLDNIKMPPIAPPPEDLLDLPLLPIDALKHNRLKTHYSKDMLSFNPIQTQVFHTIYNTKANTLVASPEKKTWLLFVELAICRQLAFNPQARILVFGSRKPVARTLFTRLQELLSPSNILVRLIAQSSDLSSALPSGVHVCIPSTFYRAISKKIVTSETFDLIISTDLQTLHTAYELSIAHLRRHHPFARFVGFSAPLADPSDLARFLGCKPVNTFSFHANVSSEPITTSFVTHSQQHSTGLLRSMIKPVYLHIRQPTAPSCLCFVPSVNQTKILLREMATLCASDIEQGPLYKISPQEMSGMAEYVTDSDLSESLRQGIGVLHNGLQTYERRLVLELFQSGVIRVLFLSKDDAWNLPNISADKVMLLGAQFWVEDVGSGRRLLDYSLPDLLHLQSFARSPMRSEFIVFCQSEQAEIYSRFLLEGLPLESEMELKGVFMDDILRHLDSGMLNAQDVLDYVSWTFIALRLPRNPSYYFPHNDEFGKDKTDEWLLARFVDNIINELRQVGLVRVTSTSSTSVPTLQLTVFGRAMLSRNTSFDDVKKLRFSPPAELLSALPESHETAFDPVHLPNLKKLYQRLSRSFKDLISIPEGQGDEGFAKVERPILLLSYASAGRIPNVERLEELQSELLIQCLERMLRKVPFV